MTNYIAPNFPTDLPCGGTMSYSRARDGFGRPIFFVHVTPKGAEGWIAPCDDWRIARIYSEYLAHHGVPSEEGAA